MKKKIYAFGAVGLLIGVICCSLVVATESEEGLSLGDENDTLWGLGHIVVTVKEIYRTKDKPQYRPLSGVKVSAHGILLSHRLGTDITDDNGKGYMSGLGPGLYSVIASKEGYTKQIRMAVVKPGSVTYITINLAEKGSVWDQQTTQTKEIDKLPDLITLATQSSKKTLSNDEENDPLWGKGAIKASVKEIYGTEDNPQYRPLSGVKVSALGILFSHGIGTGITGENGIGYVNNLFPGLYVVKASKEGYTKQIRMALVNSGGFASVIITLAEKGSVWDQETTRTKNVGNLATPITSQVDPEDITIRIMQNSDGSCHFLIRNKDEKDTANVIVNASIHNILTGKNLLTKDNPYFPQNYDLKYGLYRFDLYASGLGICKIQVTVDGRDDTDDSGLHVERTKFGLMLFSTMIVILAD